MQTKIDSLKFKWVKKILDNDVIKPWKSYIIYKFNDSLDMMLLGNLHKKDMRTVTDPFYNEILQTLAFLKYSEPSKPDEMLKQIIWNNSGIKANNKIVNYKT